MVKKSLEQRARKLDWQPIPWNPPKMKLFQLPSFYREDLTREQRLQALHEIGRLAKEQFEQEYPTIRKWFEDYDALYVLSTCLFYFVSAPEGVDVEAHGKLEFPHHFLELLQAFALMQPRSLSPQPLLQNTNRLKEEMKRIGDAIQMRGFYYIQEGMTEEEIEKQQLLQTMRAQTSGIRNWTYPHQASKMTSDLMRKIAPNFEQTIGLDPVRLVGMLNKLTDAMQAKFDSHMNGIRHFCRKSSHQTMLRAYHEAFPETVEMGDEQARELFNMAGGKIRHFRHMLLCHSDLRIEDIFTVTLDELLELYGEKSHKEALNHLLDSWSYNFGELLEKNPEHFILDNPCLKRPFIKTDNDSYFSGVLGVLPHLLLRLLESVIAKDAALKKRYEYVRAKYLEDETEAAFRGAFPNALIFRGSKWTDPSSGKNYENDLAVLIDTFMIVVECKSGAIDPPASRGADESLKELIDELMVEPARQANRFIDYLKAHKGDHSFETNRQARNTFNNSAVQYYIPCGVTLENLGVIGSNIKLALNAGFIQEEWKVLAPSINLADLQCIFELLPLEVEKIHYLARRREFERHVNYRADEVDLLGFYLDCGFNIGGDEYEGNIALNLTLKSKELDPYFVRTGRGHSEVEKPRLQMSKWWKDLLIYLSERRPHGWIESAYVLLNSTKSDQEKFEEDLAKLKDGVLAGRAPHKHNWVQGFMGPEQRRFLIACYPYITDNRGERNSIITGIFSSEEEKKSRGGVCIGIDVRKGDYPYSVLAMTEATNLLEQL